MHRTLCLVMSLCLICASRTRAAGELDAMASNAVKAAQEQFNNEAIKDDDIAVTVIDLHDADHPKTGSYRGDQPTYPASVVKLFYLAYAERLLEDKKLADSDELQRGLHDMIVDSSNDATSYILDTITDAPNGSVLPPDEMQAWASKRNAVNRYFTSLGGYDHINVNQKPYCEGPYGRERIFLGKKFDNRNQLTTNATAKLLAEIAQRKFVSAGRSDAMLKLLSRDRSTKPEGPDDQAHGFIAGALPEGAKVWSKAGWTSTARHDALYVESADGNVRAVIVVFTDDHADLHKLVPTIGKSLFDQLAASNDVHATTQAANTAPTYVWQNVTMAAPFPACDGAGALVFNDRMFLIGGWRTKNDPHPFPRVCTNAVWSSADGLNWIEDKPNTFLDASFEPLKDWEGRHTAGYVVHDGKMWIVGGDPIQGHYQNDVWNSVDGKSWTLVNKDKPVPWGPRCVMYVVAYHGYIWVMGGQTIPQAAPQKEIFYRDVWRSKDGINWEEIKPVEPFWPQRGLIGGSAVFKDRIWLLGGGTYETPAIPQRKFYNDVWSTSDGANWQQHVEHAPWHPREYHDVAVFDDKLWVLEGWNQQNRNDVWYSDDGVNWTELPGTPWKPRHASSVFVFDNSLWVVTGNNMESDVWRLNRK